MTVHHKERMVVIMAKKLSALKMFCSVIAAMVLVLGMSTVAWANNHADEPWNFYLTYNDSVTGARAKEDSSASYVYYSDGDLSSIRTAIYAYQGGNVTTETGYVSVVPRGKTAFISNTGYYARNDHKVCLHLCSTAPALDGSARGQWSPDNYQGIL